MNSTCRTGIDYQPILIVSLMLFLILRFSGSTLIKIAQVWFEFIFCIMSILACLCKMQRYLAATVELNNMGNRWNRLWKMELIWEHHSSHCWRPCSVYTQSFETVHTINASYPIHSCSSYRVLSFYKVIGYVYCNSKNFPHIIKYLLYQK